MQTLAKTAAPSDKKTNNSSDVSDTSVTDINKKWTDDANVSTRIGLFWKSQLIVKFYVILSIYIKISFV